MSTLGFASSSLLLQFKRPAYRQVRLLCVSNTGRGVWDLDDRSSSSTQPHSPHSRSPARGPSRSTGHDRPPMRRTQGERPYRSQDSASRHNRQRNYAQRSQSDNRRPNNYRSQYARKSYQDDHDRGAWNEHFDNYEPSNDDWSSRNQSRRDDDEQPSIVQRALAAVDDDLLYGVTPVLLALKARKRQRFETLYVQQGRTVSSGPSRKAENDDAVEEILTLVTARGIPIVQMDKGDLNMLSRNRPHQGLVLQTAPLDYEELKRLPKVDKTTVNANGVAPCYLVLDEVTDPQNAGALLRSAHFLGADGVIACRRNSCKLSPVVSKASAGALEIMSVQGVASMPRFLRSAREDGWRIVGTALSADAVRAKSVKLDCPTLVVLGSEGHGLRRMVREACEMLVRIEGVASSDGEVDSLNVSVAGAVALYQLLGQ